MPEEHVDVLIVGAGLSGVGAAVRLRKECPGKSVAILETRGAIGGTWDLFRYPGIRSDSDMFTLGYSFKPWTAAKAIADGDSIRDYVRETAREHGIDKKIRFRHRVLRAEFSSDTGRWTVHAHRDDTAEPVTLTCSFLYTCAGYYNYERGYTPEFAGIEDYTGRIVHPQHWPADLDYAGKRVVVIGSGATAVTLVPAMAETAAHVTMLQRSPTYIVSMPSKDAIADSLREKLPAGVAYSIIRWKNVLMTMGIFQLSRRVPGLVRSMLLKGVTAQLPEGYDVDKHFKPRYNPWDERLCLVPDGDFFKAIRAGRSSVVTDRIDRFTANGLRLASGAELDADIVITATGLNVQAVGGMKLTVDGTDVSLPDTVAYKGIMLSGVPNFALTLGYTNASWTLKADLVGEYICRLLNQMDARGQQVVTPQGPAAGEPLTPFLDLKSGYVQRSISMLPKQGPAAPWKAYQNYLRDRLLLRRGPLDDGLRFSRVAATAKPTAVPLPQPVPDNISA